MLRKSTNQLYIIMRKNYLFSLFLFLIFSTVNAQLVIDADIRPRFEYRHGFGSLFPEDTEPAAFVAQRTRLNTSFKTEKFAIKVSLQDVSTWGDTKQININDGNDSFFLFQAWIEYFINEKWSTKIGRQVISYDDQRVLGGLDWAMQGRFHDALLVKHKSGSVKLDFGFAFNQASQSTTGTTYNILGAFSYKSMQFAYFHKDWEKFKLSLLFLNNGFQKYKGVNNDVPDGVYNRQTAGTHFTIPISKVNLAANFYYQFGNADANTDLSAYEFALEANYKPGKTLFALGFEMLSGTDQTGDTKNKSFFPLYGTNHKFNGYMDYFYVGNHANNVGLNDLYAKVAIDIGDKSKFLTKLHVFSANADLANDADKYLGTELDLIFSKTLVKDVVLKVGYSHMFAGDSMSLIKGGVTNDNTNNWGWAQILVSPTIFNSANHKK